MVLCASDDGNATDSRCELTKIVPNKPGFRGPRTASLTAMNATADLEPDARDQKHRYPESAQWHAKVSTEGTCSTGVIKKITRKGDVVHIEYSGKNVTATCATTWNDTNHVTAIRGDGSVQYQQVCVLVRRRCTATTLPSRSTSRSPTAARSSPEWPRSTAAA